MHDTLGNHLYYSYSQKLYDVSFDTLFWASRNPELSIVVSTPSFKKIRRVLTKEDFEINILGDDWLLLQTLKSMVEELEDYE